MPLNLASPGIVVREVDLTSGRVQPSSSKIGAIAAPFAKGPVDSPIIIENENELLTNFGQPYSTDKQYENWMVASSYLSYGGSIRVVRADDEGMKNSFVGTATSVKIKSLDHYEELGYDQNTLAGVVVAAKNPGSWANGITIAIIDSRADQILTVSSTTGLSVGLGVSQAVPANTVLAGAGTTSLLTGSFKGIITGINTITNKVDVKVLSNVSTGGTETAIDYQPRGIYKFTSAAISFVGSGVGSTSISGTRGQLGSSAGSISAGVAITSYYLVSTLTLDTAGGLQLSASDTTIGIATAGITAGSDRFLAIDNEIISLSGASLAVGGFTGATRGSEGTTGVVHSDNTTALYLQKFSGVGTVTSTVSSSDTIIGISTNNSGISTIVNANGYLKIGSEFVRVNSLLLGNTAATTVTSDVDWFDTQKIQLTQTSSVNWNNVAPRPGTSAYAEARNSRFDEVHLVVVDSLGTISGNSGTILEKHLNLSKASDATFSVGNTSYWRKYLAVNSDYIFGLNSPVGIVTTGYSSGFTLQADFGWDQEADGTIFGANGASNLILNNGKNYGGISTITTTGALTASISEISDAYSLFENTENLKVDFLIMGSAAYTLSSAQSLAQKLISVAELRKDAIAFISPYRGAFLSDTAVQTEVTVKNSVIVTNNIVEFFAPINSSSYAVFDSGYKYVYDRFSKTFRYIPLNGDIAGLCARNDVNNFPWYSPAGTTRGSILNAVKLAYNPSKSQRDILYSNRINSIIFSPGAGIILFGDKTGLSKASAFDRINVRRLFIYLEDAISRAAKDVLFEFNDEITRTNFVNTIEPFLRDVQAKRGISDYVVIADESNNTAAVIDSNEFRADIYIKPARSINFIGLTFIATKSGVDFEEVIGNF
jgi:Phage tail sheath protein subtilisin-like domain/Phage tail sheath C-terminal domain